MFETILSNAEDKCKLLLDPPNLPPIKQLLPKVEVA